MPRGYDLNPELYEEDEEYWWLKGMTRWQAIGTIRNFWFREFPYHWLRRPRTTQECRANQDIKGEARLWRGRRAAHMLPNAYDDICIDHGHLKSWKKKSKKRHQWDK